jgi:hypothetical protein
VGKIATAQEKTKGFLFTEDVSTKVATNLSFFHGLDMVLTIFEVFGV